MILDKVSNLKNYKGILPGILNVDKFLKENDLKNLAIGKTSVHSKKVISIVMDHKTRKLTSKTIKFESHRKYADIHIVLGEEAIYFVNTPRLIRASKYDAGSDVEFFHAKDPNRINLNIGRFIIFFPGEVHAPGFSVTQSKNVRKVVFKVMMA